MSRFRVTAVAALLAVALLLQLALPARLSGVAEAARLFGRGGLLAKAARLFIAIKFPGAMIGVRTTEQIIDRRDFYRRMDRWLRDNTRDVEERQAELDALFEDHRIDVRTYNRRSEENRRLAADYTEAHDRMRAIRGEQFSRFVQQEVLDRMMPKVIDSGTFNRLVGNLNDGFTSFDAALVSNICDLERLAQSVYPRALRDLQTKIRELKRASDDSGLTEVVPEVRHGLARLDGRLSRLQQRAADLDPLGIRTQMAVAREELSRVKGIIDSEVGRLRESKTIVIPVRSAERDTRLRAAVERIEASEKDLTRSAIQEAMLRRSVGRWIDDRLASTGLGSGDAEYFAIRDAFVARLAADAGRIAFTDEVLDRAWREAVQGVLGEAPPEPDAITPEQETRAQADLIALEEFCDDRESTVTDRGVADEEPTPPPTGEVDAEALQAAMWERCIPIHDQCVEVNCDPGYSGCIPDCGGCFSMAPRTIYNEYWLELEPGYRGCADGAAGAYVGAVQACVGTFVGNSRPSRVVEQNDCLRQAWETLVKAADSCQLASCRTWCGMQGRSVQATKPSCVCAQ